jgi:hypothetical protein
MSTARLFPEMGCWRKFWVLLEKVDADLPPEACPKGCLYCREKLHRADYDRKPRGGPNGSDAIAIVVPKKIVPETLRFLGRRIYASTGGRVNHDDDSWPEARTRPSDPGSIANRLAH